MSLLTLPAEVRLLIYNHRLQDAVVELDYTVTGGYRIYLCKFTDGERHSDHSMLAILQLNRLIRNEALPIFYDRTVLTLLVLGMISTAHPSSVLLPLHWSGIRKLRMRTTDICVFRFLDLPVLELLILDSIIERVKVDGHDSLREAAESDLSIMDRILPPGCRDTGYGWFSMIIQDNQRKLDVVVTCRLSFEVCFLCL